jgi:dienelactone hydrolase
MPSAAGKWLFLFLVLGSTIARAERLSFDSAARDSRLPQLFQVKPEFPERIHGELQLPAKGAAPFPAMVLMHSSRGVEATLQDWAKMFNDMGVATFVVDSFTPRGLDERSGDQLSFPAGVVDSLRALRTLRRDRRISSARIGVIGFSRGAFAAMHSSFQRYRTAVLGADGGRFALHIAFYGGCGQYAKTTGAPILNFIGSEDDFAHPDLCRKQAELLGKLGSKVELVVYEGALHGFDTDLPRQSMPAIQNLRKCLLLNDFDTFDAILTDGRALSAEERLRYAQTCIAHGADRGGDRKYAALARERVKTFVAQQFKLP